jgi:uncharacterized protein (UPF0335 family)
MKIEKTNRLFFQLLHRHYPLIREICISGKLFSGRNELLAFIVDFYEARDVGVQPTALFERMRDCGMIVKTHAMWAPPSYLLLFIRKREGRSKFTSQHFVKACFQDIRTHVFALNSMIENAFPALDDEILEEVFAVEDVYQQLAAASQNNCHKISMEVASFQLDASFELSNSKIQRFHNLYDSYILPMLAFVADPDNELEALSAEILELADKILDVFQGRGSVSYHFMALKNSVKAIQEIIASKILQAKNELDALFEVYREHRRIMEGINRFVEIISDDTIQEKDEFFEEYCLSSDKIRHSNLSNSSFDNYLRRFIYSDSSEHKPHVVKIIQNLPESLEIEHGLVAFSEIKNLINQESNIPCVLSWLHNNYAHESASFLIEKLFEIEKYFPDNIRVENKSEIFKLSGIRIELPVREWVKK